MELSATVATLVKIHDLEKVENKLLKYALLEDIKEAQD